jgi:hypothetical protein
MSKIIWLASFPKSGNTWTRVFIMNLFMNPSQPLSINEVHKMSPSDTSSDWYNMFDDRPLTEWSLPEVARMRYKVHAEIASHAPDSIFVKTHSPIGSWEGFQIINMQVTAGTIYIVRNPLDVVASYANHSGLTIDPIIEIMNRPRYMAPASEHAAPHPIDSWRENVSSWTAHPHPALHVMRYEDMVQKPEETFGSLVRFLGLPQDKGRLTKAIEFSSFDQLKTMEDNEGFVDGSKRGGRFFRGGRIDGWRDELTSGQARAIIEVNREQMQRFGYVPKGL